MSQAVRVVPCPCCGANVRWEAASLFRPFCSERCKMIDLGEWAKETYRVPAVEESPDSEIDPSRYS